MFVGAFLPDGHSEAHERIELSGETIGHRTSSLHRSNEMEQFDLVVVLEGDPHGDAVVADYTPRCEVMILTFEQLAKLGKAPAAQPNLKQEASAEDGGRDQGESGGAPRPEEEAAPAAEEAPPQKPQTNGSAKVSEDELRAMKRPALLKYAAARYPGQRRWISLGGNDKVVEAVLELGG